MEDEKIIDLYWRRQESAIVETESKYGRFLRHTAYGILRNHEDAKECENDTYEAAWNTIPPEMPGSLMAYLGRIVRNIACDRYDYSHAKRRNHEFDVLLSELEECIASTDTVEGVTEAGYVAGVISDCLRGLDKESRCMFVRRYWYSDSIKELSGSFGMSESKVKSNLFRTRKKLREYLKQEGVIV